MRLAALLVLAACDAGAKQPQPRPPATGSATAPVQTIDATIVAVDAAVVAPCSSADLKVAGEQQTPRLVPKEDCDLRWDDEQDVVAHSMWATHGVKGSDGKVMAPPPQRVLLGDGGVGPNAVEVTSAKEMSRFVRCRRPPHVDWKRDHVWVVTFSAEAAFMSIGSLIDDGHAATMGVIAGMDKSCGDAAPPMNKLFELVIVPADRDVSMRECHEHYRDPCPNYR